MITPLRDQLVLRPLKEPGKLGLLYVPDIGMSGNKNSAVCEVLAVGPGDYRRRPLKREEEDRGCIMGKRFGDLVPCTAKAGDKVMVACYGTHFAGDEVNIGGEKFIIIRERDILGILHD